MNGIFTGIGIITVFTIIVYLCKKGFEYLRRPALYESQKIYKAADMFSKGASREDIEEMLNNCIEFDEDDVTGVLSYALGHTADIDGGYGAFLYSVNKVLGENTYNTSRKQGNISSKCLSTVE